MVDTLEKFQDALVNTQSQAGKDFILFKRQLYQMYEVQNRSLYEHEQFSIGVERQNLKWLYLANMNYVRELSHINRIDDLVDHGQLKGSLYRAKMMSPNKLKGVGALGASAFAFMHWGMLSMMMGPAAPAVGIVALAAYGTSRFAERNTISQIDFVSEGENAGKLRLKITKSPIMTYGIVTDAKNVRSVVSLGNDDFGEDNLEGNVVVVDEYLNEETGETERDAVFTLPADASRSRQVLEWVLTPKAEESKTDAAFADLLKQKHEETAATGGITGLYALEAKQTGFANQVTDKDIDAELNTPAMDQQLARLTDMYGKEKLDAMSSTELYNLYKMHSLYK